MSAYEQASTLLGHLRIQGAGDGPMYGALKADAATAYALLAVCDRLDKLIELQADREEAA